MLVVQELTGPGMYTCVWGCCRYIFLLTTAILTTRATLYVSLHPSLANVLLFYILEAGRRRRTITPKFVGISTRSKPASQLSIQLTRRKASHNGLAILVEDAIGAGRFLIGKLVSQAKPPNVEARIVNN
jgi:hypothetical protein